MVSYLFQNLSVSPDSLIVEGWHKPSTLTTASGAWVGRAGSAMLDAGEHPLNPLEQYVWFCIESGSLDLKWKELSIHLEKSDACVIPAGNIPAVMSVAEQAYVIWLTFDGPLAGSVVRQMGALLHTPIRQKSLPSQAYLAKQIVQVMVRHSGTDNATYQLQHLMYGLLASRWGQPVAMDAMLSHEIAKVVDALRAGQYKDNFSLQQMADISRIPMETFRKRFVSEVGMPPLSYVLYCKMEQAKELLRDRNYTVREAGAEVGMKDPYHFSKQFKSIVGISPSAFVKQAAEPEDK